MILHWKHLLGIYHQTDANKKNNGVSFHSGVTQYTQLSNNTQSESKQSCQNISSETDSITMSQFVKEMNGLDSSQVPTASNNNGVLILKNKVYYTFKPHVNIQQCILQQ